MSNSMVNGVAAAVRNQALEGLHVRIFADGADREGMLSLYTDPLIGGMTTDPTLMNKAGIHDYEAFAKDILSIIRDKPISFEVFSDEFPEMRRQAIKIRNWGSNVYVKIPVTNTRGEGSFELVRELSKEGVKLNVTAILTLDQVRRVAQSSFAADVAAVVSVFAGRIADAGCDPVPLMRAAKCLLADLPGAELLWASVHEVWNIFQAECRRLSHRNGSARHSCQSHQDGWNGSRGALARYRPYVRQRRRAGRLSTLTFSPNATRIALTPSRCLLTRPRIVPIDSSSAQGCIAPVTPTHQVSSRNGPIKDPRDTSASLRSTT